MRRIKGFTLIELLVVIAIIALLVSILAPGLNRVRELANRTKCKTNVSNIGKGLAMYQHGHGDQYPYINSSPTALVTTPTGVPTGLVNNKPAADSGINISSFLFLLVRDGQAPNIFVCPSTEDRADANTRDNTVYHWDFSSYANNGNREAISYSYQAPIHWHADGTYYVSGVTSSSESGLVILADRSPTYAGLPTDQVGSGLKFNWAAPGDAELTMGMSQNHTRGEWVNALCADTHVIESARADIGILSDSIYSSANSTYTAANNPPVDPEYSRGGDTATDDISKHISERDTFLIGPTLGR